MASWTELSWNPTKDTELLSATTNLVSDESMHPAVVAMVLTATASVGERNLEP